MLSTKHPSILLSLRDFRYGLMPLLSTPAGSDALLFKIPQEAILTARRHNQVKVYLLSDEQGPASHLGLVTAFFDDIDEPLMIATPLFSGDELPADFITVLSQPVFDTYFFDEHDREWLGARAANPDAARCRCELAAATFAPFNLATYSDFGKRLQHRFAVRTANDDRAAFTLTLGERLYPDDIALVDHRPEPQGSRVARPRPPVIQLVREDPGPPQERDIAALLGRAFPPESIHLNPFRADTSKELTDLLVVTDREMLFIQAKDSPNTAAALDRSIERKRRAVQKQIEKAARQLRGGLSYARDHGGVTVQTLAGPSPILRIPTEPSR